MCHEHRQNADAILKRTSAHADATFWRAALAHGHATLEQDKLAIGGVAARLGIPALFVGAVALAAAAYNAFHTAPLGEAQDLTTHFFHAYLAAYTFFMAITLGSLAFVMIQHLTRAGWSVTVRRVAEGLALNVFLLIILTVPFFIPVNGVDGVHRLFPHWFMPTSMQEDDMLLAKSGYLNPKFFAIRMGVYFLVWSLLAWFYSAKSAEQDRDGNPRTTVLMERVSMPAMIFFAFSLTSFIIDWVMALNPHWFSTIFGVYYFAGCMLSALSTITLVVITLQKRDLVGKAVSTEHFHDLGKLMFAFTFFWGYIAFSQYMLIWYANMPEETQFYVPRQWEHWASFSLMLLIVHLVIPFPGLLSRHGKRKNAVLAFWAVWSLCACALDICWLVLPSQWISQVGAFAQGAGHGSEHQYLPNAMANFADRHDIYHVTNRQLAEAINYPLTIQPITITILCFIGIGGLYIFSTMLALRGKSLVPTKDPRLAEALAFENI
jgi:hypothetical protein